MVCRRNRKEVSAVPKQTGTKQITYDVFELGVIDWALGDREAPCPGSIYSFRRLRAQDT